MGLTMKISFRFFVSSAIITMLIAVSAGPSRAASSSQTIPIGFNYPKSGPYSEEGMDQLNGARLAVEEINSMGGILGKKIELIIRDSASDVRKTQDNVKRLIEDVGVKMIFGGVSSAVAISSCSICQEHVIPFFGTMTYSTATTGEEAHRACFRETYNSWMAAKVLADYMKLAFRNKRFFYITVDYTWGWTTEKSLRLFTETTNEKKHPGKRVRMGTKNFIDVLRLAQQAKPDVLVLVLGGKDLVNALRQATVMGSKNKSQIVVPNLTLNMARGAGPKAMADVIGALPWTWRVPYTYHYQKGIQFVESFKKRFNTYPGSSAASAYTILYEYKSAAEKHGSLDSASIIRALEGHAYVRTKDRQVWRKFDHQSVQTVYMVRGKSAREVMKSPLKQDYFEILHALSGEKATRTFEQWKKVRELSGKSLVLEKLPDE